MSKLTIGRYGIGGIFSWKTVRKGLKDTDLYEYFLFYLLKMFICGTKSCIIKDRKKQIKERKNKDTLAWILTQTARQPKKHFLFFFCIQALKTSFIFHASCLQAVIQRVSIVSIFFFFCPLLFFIACHWRPSYENTSVYVFTCKNQALLSLLPKSSKTCHLYLDLQKSPQFIQVVGGMGSPLEEGHRLVHVSVMYAVKMCMHVCMKESLRKRSRKRLRKRTEVWIVPDDPHRHFHSRWSGSAAIWRPRWQDKLRYLQTPTLFRQNL